MNIKKYFRFAVISAILTLPTLGFIFGFFNCKDCGYNVLTRSIIGLVHSVIVTLNFGVVPLDEGLVKTISLRIYIVPIFCSIFLFIYVLKYILNNKK